MDFPAVALTNLSEPEEKRLPIIVRHKHVITSVATGHHMINRSWIFKPGLPSHAALKSEIYQKARVMLIREQ